MEQVAKDLVLFSGYAKLPIGITAGELYKIVGVVVTVEMQSGEIIEADCTLATELARRHIARALIGHCLQEGPEKLAKIVEHIYQGNAKKSIITAIRIIFDKYHSYKEALEENSQ
ncbi:MAG: DUF3870 domain-containing protein [Pelosinus sp.]|nr:DUF3870 domain-containing protein [Pelosinus sp.]